jgi:hypothetical protein
VSKDLAKYNCKAVSQRRLEQVPELIVLTNSKSFWESQAKEKRKEEKKGTYNL